MHFSATLVLLLLGLAASRAASLAKLEESSAKDALPASDELEEQDRSKKSVIYTNPQLGGSRLAALLGLQVAPAINVPQYLQVPGAAVLADPLVVPGVQTVGEIIQPATALPAVNYLPQPAILEEVVQPALRPWGYPFYGRPDFYNPAPVAAYNDPLVLGGLSHGLYPDAALISSPYIDASSPYGLYPDAALLSSPYIGASSPYGLYSDAALLSPYIGASSPYGLAPYSYLY